MTSFAPGSSSAASGLSAPPAGTSKVTFYAATGTIYMNVTSAASTSTPQVSTTPMTVDVTTFAAMKWIQPTGSATVSVIYS
jgi:hypothetical protein